MKRNAIVALTAFTALFARAAETTNVTAVIDGRRVAFNVEIGSQLAQRSVDVLASCAYLNAKPNWGDPGEPRSIAEAQKQSHLQVVFSSPRKVSIPIEKITVHARELVVTLPVASAGVWVRTDDGILYCAKFEHTRAEHLQKLVDAAQKP